MKLQTPDPRKARILDLLMRASAALQKLHRSLDRLDEVLDS